MSTHTAAISPSKGAPLQVVQRTTPKPGSTELLVEVHSIALNPIDYYQRDHALPPITHFPAVLGSDIGGVVVSSGASVTNAPKPGTRVAAFAQTFYTQGKPDYGAFQKLTLIPSAFVCPIPDSISLNEASILGMAVLTSWSALYTIGLPRDTHFTPADKQGFLVWGGASSVGSATVQIAKILGFSVYVAASPKHTEYLKTLGAAQVFDYKSPSIVSDIIAAAKTDGVQINYGHDIVGQLAFSSEILQKAKGPDVKTAGLASAMHFRTIPGWEEKKVEGVEIKFTAAPGDAEERNEHAAFVFNVWLKEMLANGKFVPSPKIRVLEGGLEGLNRGLDTLREGVSGTKLVLEI